MVFVDDSKFERDLVKKHLPMIAVPDIGDEPENFVFHLDREKYFNTLDLSKEDLARASYYKKNIKRENEMLCLMKLLRFFAASQNEVNKKSD